MENLAFLRRTCPHHLWPTRLTFLRWAGPFRVTYGCPSCNRTQTFARAFRFAPVQRVG
jgi:hypothetical protein